MVAIGIEEYHIIAIEVAFKSNFAIFKRDLDWNYCHDLVFPFDNNSTVEILHMGEKVVLVWISTSKRATLQGFVKTHFSETM